MTWRQVWSILTRTHPVYQSDRDKGRDLLTLLTGGYRKREVEAPQGVRIERADGTVLPVELVYEGRVGGLHRWVVAGVVVHDGDVLVCDVIPARTTLAVIWRDELGHD